jgi:hypothetical protein
VRGTQHYVFHAVALYALDRLAEELRRGTEAGIGNAHARKGKGRETPSMET